MNRFTGLILALVLGLSLPASASAQRSKKPTNNMWTRSVALYLDRARDNPRPDEKRALYQQALEAALDGMKNDPENPKVWFVAGQAYLKLGDYAGADSVFDRAEQLYPEYVKETDVERNNAWITAYNAGVTALQSGSTADAITHMQKADVIYAKRPAARLTLASLYAREARTDEAISTYRGALEILRGPHGRGLNPKDEEQWKEQEEIVSFNLAQLLASAGRDEEAAQAYRDYLGREPGNLTAKINLAVVLIRQGKAAEASQTYTELLAQPDLSADEYFRIGVGLFRAEDYPRAGEAFRKALQLNPHHRDSYYNLAQTLYVRTSPLEDARAKAKGDELKKVNAELGPLYGEVRQLAEKLREYDPANRNVLALLARAYRGLGDAAADVKTGDQWKLKAVGVLTLYQEMPFEVVELSLSGAEGEVALKGTLQNLKLKQGEPIKLRLSLLGATGAAVATQEVTVAAPAVEETATFEAKAKVQEGVAGWKYEVLP